MKNNKGFTLIELLAVVTIMGILMLVAIPVVSRITENARQVSLVDTAKAYVSSARTLWMSDNLTCGGTVASAVPDGDYYILINTNDVASEKLPKLLEQGGQSAWGNKDLNGYVRVNVKTTDAVDSDGDGVFEKDTKRVLKYYVALSDGAHGVVDDNTKVAGNLKRSDVKIQLSDVELKMIELTTDDGSLNCAIDDTGKYICTEVTPVTDITAICIDENSAVNITGVAKFPPENFETDEWSTVVNAFKEGIHPYQVGDTKEVDLGSYGVHKLRIANLSRPEECDQPGFSQTACGVVLEFVDAITTSTIGSGSSSGSWPARPVRTLINNDIYNLLPPDLKNAIIDTTVVSGYGGRTGSDDNYTSTDKLYLLATGEVWLNGASGDTATHLTRQLDYYTGLSIDDYSSPKAVKQYNGTNINWWLRTPYSGNSYLYSLVSTSGSYGNYPTNYSHGVSPAFRIDSMETGNGGNVNSEPSPEDFEKFENDSWSTIISNLRSGNHTYPIGASKEVFLNGFGTCKIRLANLSTPSECNQAGFSQTACGIVLEFEDIITYQMMYSAADSNVGGWPASNLRTFVNNNIYNVLPSQLKNAIIDTRVVSGHGSTAGESNFVSTDKLYILSSSEVYQVGISRDTAKDSTRQLDYYKQKGVTTRNFAKAKKTYTPNPTNSRWWLRTPNGEFNSVYYYIASDGNYDNTGTRQNVGVSPAFRIG